MADDTFIPTPRTRVRRLPKRASYDRTLIHSILDEGFVCHIGFAAGGQSFVIPTGYARADDQIYIHGSAASRMLGTIAEGIDLCLTVTLTDGFVLARSAFHHSLNYRSVVVLGKARLVTEPAEKLEALRRFTNHLVPGRWEEVRPPDEQELRATTVLALPLEEVSAKVRSGPPIDDEADYAWPVWAGVVPLRTSIGEPVTDGRVPAATPTFDIARLTRTSRT